MKTRPISAALLLLMLFASALMYAQQFIANPVLPAGEHAVGAALTADFNGDGKMDLAFSGGGNSAAQLVIQLGNGDGGFTISQTIPGELYGDGIVTADWNADGIPDLAIAGYDFSCSVIVYLGAGDGTFTQVNNYPFVNLGLQSMAAGDLNGDGLPDLVTADGPAGISVLLGQGNGNFSAPVTYPQADLTYYIGITTGDFNQDGKLDVAATGKNTDTGANDVVIYLGRGDGTFEDTAEFPVGDAERLITADFNHDGIPDLATGGVCVLLGNGDGTFQPERFFNSLLYDSYASGIPLAAADLDGDGNLDLMAAGGPLGPSAVSVLRGNGNGTFQPAVELGTSTPAPIALLVADYNTDGRLDVVAPDALEACFNLMLGDANGKFVARRVFSLKHSLQDEPYVTALAVADVNSDGNLDVVMTDDGESDAPRLIIMNGQKNGTFIGPKDVPLEGKPGATSIDMADFNGDGKPDVVTANGMRISVLLGDGHNHFGSRTDYDGSGGPYQVIAADVNGDGKPDIVGVNRGASTISVFLNNGAGHFGTRVDSAVGYVPFSIAVGDFNRDGKIDVVTAVDGKHDPTAVVLMGHGDGTFTQAALLTSGGGGYGVTVGDFNNDGNPDVLVESGHLLFYPGNGDGTFGTFKVDQPCGIGSVGDFNRDGNLDMVAICGQPSGYNLAQYLIGNGDGTFQGGQSTEIDGDNSEGVGDFNHDGALDFVTASESFYKYSLAILLNTGAK